MSKFNAIFCAVIKTLKDMADTDAAQMCFILLTIGVICFVPYAAIPIFSYMIYNLYKNKNNLILYCGSDVVLFFGSYIYMFFVSIVSILYFLSIPVFGCNIVLIPIDNTIPYFAAVVLSFVPSLFVTLFFIVLRFFIIKFMENLPKCEQEIKDNTKK